MDKIIPFVDHEIGYRLLEKLIHNSLDSEYTIPLVVTTAENSKSWWPSVKSLCKAADIPLVVYEFPSVLDKIRAEWILLLSWKYIVPSAIIKLPTKGILNLHYSLLPSYRGVYPVNWAIISGEKKAGFSVHHVNKYIDQGQIFSQAEVLISPEDTARTLQLKIDNLVCEKFDDIIKDLVAYLPDPDLRLKDSQIQTCSQYYSRRMFEQACKVDLHQTYTAKDLINLLRGLSFVSESRLAYFVDDESGKKYYLRLQIIPEA